MWGFMICPGGLVRPGALDLIKQVLKDSFVIPVFRDKTLNIHAEFEALGKWFKLKDGAPEGKFSMKKSATKKYFTDAVEDWQWTIRSHHELRVFLRNELNTLSNFFTEAPGALAPKIQVLLISLWSLSLPVMKYSFSVVICCDDDDDDDGIRWCLPYYIYHVRKYCGISVISMPSHINKANINHWLTVISLI
jgi:hypothetical protein